MIHRGDYCELCASDCYACMQGIVDHECTSGCHCCDRGDDPVDGLHYTIDTDARTIKCTRRSAPAPPVSEGLTIERKYRFSAIINNWLKGESFVPMTYERLAAFACDIVNNLTALSPRQPEIETHGVTFLDPPLSEEEAQRAKELKATQQPCKCSCNPFCGCECHKSSPRDMKAGPRCPKCGSGEIEDRTHIRGVKPYVKCLSNNCRAEIPVDKLADFSQFSPSPEQGWVKTTESLPINNTAVLAVAWWADPKEEYSCYQIHDCMFYEGGPKANSPQSKLFIDNNGEELKADEVQFWIYKRTLAAAFPIPENRTIPAPPRPSTEEGK